MHVAVIVPYRSRAGGEESLLEWALQGYRRQELSSEHTLEVLVGVDGDAAPRLNEKSGVTFHVFPRMGAAAVRNALAAKTKADLLIFGNADARPDRDMVQRHIDAMGKLPPGSMVLGSAPWERPAGSTVFDALLAETPMVFFYNSLKAGESYDFRHAWTLNLSIRASDFRAAAGFPEELRPVYYEDLALGFRVLGPTRKGIYYEPSARVTHRHPTTLEQYLDREELLGLMAPVLARVCPETFAAIHGTPDAAILANEYRAWVQMDAPSHRWIYQRLGDWARKPESSLGTGPARDELLMTIYQMHIPLKRLAFRLGFLKGLELVEDTHWQKRQPQGLWRKIAADAHG